jgi:hypothetical protein
MVSDPEGTTAIALSRQWSIRERVHLVSLAVERKRVRACFRRYHFFAAHCSRR